MVSRNATLIKKGPGRLNLGAPRAAGNEYYLAFDVQEGSVYMPQDYPAKTGSQLVRTITLAENTLFVAQNVGSLQFGGATGSGKFVVPDTATVTGTSRFDGVFSCTNIIYVRGNFTLTNPNNYFGNVIKAYRSYVTDEATVGFTSSGSVYNNSLDFNTESWGGEFVYLGNGGDTFPNRIDIRNLKRDEQALGIGAILNAGPNGGVTFTGGMRFAYGGYSYPTGTPGVWPFYLDGSNTVNEAVFSGKMQENATASDGPYIYKLVKRGSGIWKIVYNSSSSFTGPVAVENGTLRFDTIAEAGVNCALGFASNLYNATYTNIYTDCGYAIMLGATNSAGESTEGTMEYTGNSYARITTRPTVVRTAGRIKSSAAALDFSGVSAKTDGGEGAAVLALDGDAGVTNILRDVADGEGTLSVVKDGTGDWMLAGTQDFSGSLTVNGGRLTLQNPNAHDYVYYRWLIKENGFASPLYIDPQTNGTWSTAAAEVVIASVAGMDLYDEDGKEIMTATNMTVLAGGTKDPATLKPGQVTYDTRFNATYNNVNLNALIGLFDNLVTTMGGGNSTKAKFDAADSNSWVAIVWRMPEGARRAVKFDYCQYYNATGSTGGRGIVNSELQASVDGYTWDTVWSKTDAVINGSWKWISDPTGTSFDHQGDVSLAKHPGLDLDRTVSMDGTTFRTGNGLVSVAPGAELVADGPFTVSNLCISASGAGSFNGVTFAENGGIEVGDMPAGVELPGAFADVSGLENLSTWTVYRNGVPCSRLHLKAIEDGIVLCKDGGTLIFVK